MVNMKILTGPKFPFYTKEIIISPLLQDLARDLVHVTIDAVCTHIGLLLSPIHSHLCWEFMLIYC